MIFTLIRALLGWRDIHFRREATSCSCVILNWSFCLGSCILTAKYIVRLGLQKLRNDAYVLLLICFLT